MSGKTWLLLGLLAAGFAVSDAWGRRSAGPCVVCEVEELARAAQEEVSAVPPASPRTTGDEPNGDSDESDFPAASHY